MTFHNKPEWHILDLNEALREHGLPVDKPSQYLEENLQND